MKKVRCTLTGTLTYSYIQNTCTCTLYMKENKLEIYKHVRSLVSNMTGSFKKNPVGMSYKCTKTQVDSKLIESTCRPQGQHVMAWPACELRNKNLRKYKSESKLTTTSCEGIGTGHLIL